MQSASEITRDGYIHTQAGRFFLERPEWNKDAMAHAMAQTARFRGNADTFYSVAEHSVLVSKLMEDLQLGDPREGLWHDAAESVLPDVSSPWKKHFPDLRAVEKKMERSIRQAFGLILSKSQGCTEADWLALFIEASQILPERGADFDDPYGLRPMALQLARSYPLFCFEWRAARDSFNQQRRRVDGG